ncbi:hypothetical protein [Dokdonella soli]|uniref:Uncharacterized protein n=1 Tax=Dokdonella soli TaxID=529810 RepID=A0ABN1IBA8_9GAMM
MLGIRERNLTLITAIEEILGLDKGKTWEDVRRELSDDHVVAIHKAIADLWPPDTDLEALLPRPQRGRLRALYFGVPDFRMLEPTITGWLAYFDEIVIVHPFTNPVSVRPEYSPVVSPAQHREQTLKNVLLFLELEPYIGFGLLHVIPDPGDFNAEFGWNAMRMAEERTSAMELDEESARRFQGMYGDEALRYVRRLPEPALRHYIKQQTPSIPDALLDEVVAHMKAQLNDDPIALLQPLEVGTANAQLRVIKGCPLEGALYLATLTGSIVYTDVPIYWRQLHEHTVAARDGMDPVWMPMVEALRHVEYPLGVHARTVLRPRMSDAFEAMRTALRAVGDAAANRADARPHEALAASLRDAVEPMRRDWNPMSAEPWVGAQLEFSVPRGGFARQEVHRLLITYGKARTVVPVTMALFVRYTSPRNFSTETAQSADAADARMKPESE